MTRPFRAEPTEALRAQTRRHFLHQCRLGLGGMALASMDTPLGALRTRPQGGRRDRAPRAKSVIYLHMAGSPPSLELFDYKPELQRLDRKPCPDSLLANERFAFIKGHPSLLGTPYRFAQHGASGAWVSELMPHLARTADRITFVKSMHTDQFNHAPAQLLLHTGSPRFGRPSMGAWSLYGLGNANQNLPGYVVLVSGGKFPSAGKSLWGTGFLPTVHQGLQLRSTGDPVLYLTDPKGMDRGARRRMLDALGDLNRMQHARVGDPETETRIAQYELAFRMQMSVPEVTDLTREPESVRALYGADPAVPSFANHCLLARRLVEHGVRFVQLFDWGWDAHGTGPSDDIIHQLPRKCHQTDRPIAALLADLDRRGLLDETLVIWGGEFGRTPMNEERNGSKFLGRDHHPHCFTMWLAGGGIRRGATIGATDELGYHITEDPVHVHDLQATVLHLLGLDHERLTYRFQGRDFRLTDVAGRVRRDWLA